MATQTKHDPILPLDERARELLMKRIEASASEKKVRAMLSLKAKIANVKAIESALEIAKTERNLSEAELDYFRSFLDSDDALLELIECDGALTKLTKALLEEELYQARISLYNSEDYVEDIRRKSSNIFRVLDSIRRGKDPVSDSPRLDKLPKIVLEDTLEMEPVEGEAD